MDQLHDDIHDDHKKLINNLTNERVPTENERADIKQSIGYTLSGDEIFFPKHKKNAIKKSDSITKYISPLPSKLSTQKYNHDKEPLLERMTEHYKKLDNISFMKDADVLLTTYREYLSFDDIIGIYFLILNIRLEENTKENKDGIDDTLALIEHIQGYKKELNPDALHLFWRYVSLACNVKAVSQGNNMYYLRTIQAVDNFLTTSTGDILAVKSEHRDILYAKAYSLYALHENEKVFPAIQDFLDACGRDPVKKTHNDHRDSFRLAETFFMQGETYEAICDYDKAIESYKNYLVFDPGKEDIEESIATCTKLLQSKKKPPK